MSTLTEIGDLMEASVLGAQGTNIFLGSRPDKPDDCLTIYEYPGGAPEYVQESVTPNQELPQIQIVARSLRYEDADDIAKKAWKVLSAIRNTTLSGTKYRSIKPNQSPGSMGRDTNDRLLVFFNATVEKEVSLVA